MKYSYDEILFIEAPCTVMIIGNVSNLNNFQIEEPT